MMQLVKSEACLRFGDRKQAKTTFVEGLVGRKGLHAVKLWNQFGSVAQEVIFFEKSSDVNKRY